MSKSNLLPIGTRVIASCPFHGFQDQPGVVDGYVDKRIYPTNHGEYLIKFDSDDLSCYGCDADAVSPTPITQEEG